MSPSTSVIKYPFQAFSYFHSRQIFFFQLEKTSFKKRKVMWRHFLILFSPKFSILQKVDESANPNVVKALITQTVRTTEYVTLHM